jgi:hypothetical protein
MARKATKIAIAYDFDGTLAPGNMQEHSFIPNLGIKKEAFWEDVKKEAEAHDMNEILAYMQLMLKHANHKGLPITKKSFIKHGNEIKFFAGVASYFDRINAYAKRKNIAIEHYVISSGLRDIIRGTSIWKNFEAVFASAYKYDSNDVAEWPALAVDYTNKTQFLFRINKGIKNSWDNSNINRFYDKEERPMPFRRMFYVGDGETDVPAMKMITYQGGKAIAVYNPDQRTKSGRRAKQVCKNLIEQKRANYMAPADYRSGSPLFRIIQLLVDKAASDSELKTYKR